MTSYVNVKVKISEWQNSILICISVVEYFSLTYFRSYLVKCYIIYLNII